MKYRTDFAVSPLVVHIPVVREHAFRPELDTWTGKVWMDVRQHTRASQASWVFALRAFGEAPTRKPAPRV